MCKLHSTVKADEASIEATNSALKALSKFKKESFKCSHLTLQVSQKSKTKTKQKIPLKKFLKDTR